MSDYTDLYKNTDKDTDKNLYEGRESFAIQSSIIMNTLTDLLERLRVIERILRFDQDMHTTHTLDVFKTSRLVEEPPKKRMKLE